MTPQPRARGTRGRLLFLGAFPPSAVGSRAVSEDVARQLEARGWQATLRSGHRHRAFRVADVLAGALGARRTADVAHVDVYSGAALRWAEWATAVLERAGVPTVLTLHGGNLPRAIRAEPARIRRLVARAQRVVAPSGYLQEAVAPLGVQPQVIPNGLYLDRYLFAPRSAAAPRLVWVRAFHAIYNPQLAVEVLARLVVAHPDATLVMVGPDKDGSAAVVAARAAALGVADRVTFVGGQPKERVPSFLADADIFLNTSDVDNMPVTVLEAAACGLGIVSTSVGGVPHLVRDGREALLVPPRDADAMAAAVGRILADSTLAHRLSSGARGLAALHDWGAIADQWEALFTSVAERPAAL